MQTITQPTPEQRPAAPSVSTSDLFGEEAYNLLDRTATLLSLDLERPRVMAAMTYLIDSAFKRAAATKDAEKETLRKALRGLMDRCESTQGQRFYDQVKCEWETAEAALSSPNNEVRDAR